MKIEMVVLIGLGVPAYKTLHTDEEGPMQPGDPTHQLAQVGIGEL